MAPSHEQTPILVPTAPKFAVDHHGKHATYVGELSKKYRALSQHFREEPASPPHRLSEGQEDRIRALRLQIQDAWVNADGNPADGKWASVTKLVRLGSISGRNGRWMGTRKDLPLAPEPEQGVAWVNPKSEAEWKEWEKKYHEGLKVKDKVENWKKHLETVAPTVPRETNHKITDATRQTSSKPVKPTSSTIQPPPAAKSSAAVIPDPLQASNPLGFRVVKRTSQTTTTNGKPQPPLPSTCKPKLPTRQQKFPAAPAKFIQDVSDIPDLSFMPPASPTSHFATSTPKPTKHLQSAGAQPVTSSPLPSLTPSPKRPHHTLNILERNNRTRPRISSSLPAIPMANSTGFTQTSDSVNSANQLNANKKRPLPELQSLPTGANASDRRAKKPRTLSEDEVASALQKPTTSISPELGQPQSPTTPTQRKRASSNEALSKLPKLTDLLASAQSPRRTNISKMKRAVSPKKAVFNNKLQDVPEIADNDLPGSNLYVFDPFASRPPGLDGGAGHDRDSSPNMPLAVDDNLNVDEELLANMDQLEYDLASPSKSLSSLAGSEEEDELSDDDALPTAPRSNFDFNLDSSFRPLATSTQVPRGPFVSKVNLETTSQRMSQQNGETSNVVDSWESVYASGKPSSNVKAAVPVLPSSATSSTNIFLPSSSAPKPSFPIYNSQFEKAVDAQVDEFDKILGKDIDFSNWVHPQYANGDDENDGDDHSDGDRGPGEATMSQTGYSGHTSLQGGYGQNGSEYGYGRAYEYDESR